MTMRAAFLIIAACIILHTSPLQAGIVLAGYFAFARLDECRVNRARDEVFDYHTSGWIPDSENARTESKGSVVRVRLADNEQIIVTRIAQILRSVR